MPEAIPFIDLDAQRDRIRDRVDEAIRRVLDHGQFIMGPEVATLEDELSEYCGVGSTVTCASGTDALLLVLLALGVGPGDAVFVPAFTFAATAEVVALCRATPVFVDVLPDDFNMDPASLEHALQASKGLGLTPRGVIPVDLFGQPADYAALNDLARAHQCWVLSDAAQSFGAAVDGRRTGSIVPITATSFFPAKPLGCYGDGGAVFLADEALADLVRSIRVHGKGSDKYDNVRIGINGRLDTIQAAILSEKLRIFDGELEAREQIAQRYNCELEDVVSVPRVRAGRSSAWAQYTVLVADRDRVAATLRAAGVPTAVYYPLPLHRQRAYAQFPTAPSGLPVSERLADEVLSLPMSPYLQPAQQDRVIEGLRSVVRS